MGISVEMKVTTERCLVDEVKSEDKASRYYKWLNEGVSEGWVSDVACAVHDGIPHTDEEDAMWDEGLDPCEPVLRVWGPEGRPG